MTDEEKIAIANVKIAHVDLKMALQEIASLGMNADIDFLLESIVGARGRLVRSTCHIHRSKTVFEIDERF